MISPTGLGLREDRAGSGRYRASRGKRKHGGYDFLCVNKQWIVAPFEMTIVRVARPYSNTLLSGIAWESETMAGKMFYFEVDRSLVGETINVGEYIGTAQSVSEYYKDELMKDHIHFEINSLDPAVLLELTEIYLKESPKM